MEFDEYHTKLTLLVDDFRSKDAIDQDKLSDLLHATYNLLSSPSEDHYNDCLAVICHVADRYRSIDAMNRMLLDDCIVKSRIFLYEEMLEAKKEHSLLDLYAKNFYTLDKTGTVLTRDQKAVFDIFMKKSRLVVSAPTSFGKTRLLEEILIAKDYKVCVLVFPTLALLAEQYKRLKSRSELSAYHISTSSKIVVNADSKYILMLTPERLSLFLDAEINKDLNFDFFCVDEIYKADREQGGNRKYFFADTIYKLARYNPGADFYLIGPYLKSFSSNFLTKFDATFLQFKSEVVQKDYYDLDTLKATGNFLGVNKSATKKARLAKTLNVLREQDESKSLVFCKDKHTTQLVAGYAAEERGENREMNQELADYIASSVSENWSLVKYIRSGVAYHNANIPRHIQELIVDAFENKGGRLDILACTTTLIEGVNTSAKNIIFFDSKVASDKIDLFTQKNIEGRAGRLTKHFLGKIYYLDEGLKVDDQKDGDLDVELEIFADEKPSGEVAIQLETDDLNHSGKNVVEDIANRANKDLIPLTLLKGNKFISIDRQIELVNYIRSSNLGELDLNNVSTLEWVLRQTHNYLFNEKDKVNETSLEKYYIPKSVSYILHPVSLKRLIDENIQWRTVNRPNETIDQIISGTIKFYSNYIEYAWPRYISAFARIYNFVQIENGNQAVDFDLLIAKLEYGSANKQDMLLREAGVPFEIIQKISRIFESCQNPEDIYRICDSSIENLQELLSGIEYRVLRYYI